jgi:ribonuclease HI
MSQPSVTHCERVEVDRGSFNDGNMLDMNRDQINSIIFQPGGGGDVDCRNVIEGGSKDGSGVGVSILNRLTILCWNIRGIYVGTLRSLEKLKIIMNLAEEKGAHIILLQETHMKKGTASFLNSTCKGFIWFCAPGSGSSEGVAIGVRSRVLRGEQVNIINTDRSGRWIIADVPVWGQRLVVTSIYVPSFIKEVTLGGVRDLLNERCNTWKIVGGDFNLDTLKDNSMLLYEWLDSTNLLLTDNHHVTYGNVSIIDHFAVGDFASFYDCSLEVRVGNGLDHSILCLEMKHKEASAIKFPHRRLDPAICSSGVIHKEALLRMAPYSDQNPFEYLKEFGSQVRKIITEDKRVVGEDTAFGDLCQLVSCLNTNGPDHVPLAARDNHFIQQVVDQFESYDPPSVKAARRKWKALMRKAIIEFRTNFGVKVSHLFPSRPKLPRWKFRKKATLVVGGRRVNDNDTAEKYLGEFWEGIFGEVRAYDDKLLKRILRDHPSISGCAPERYKINMKKLAKIFDNDPGTSAGHDGNPFSMFVASFELLKGVWCDLIEGIANGDVEVNDDFGDNLLSLIAKREGDVECKDFRPIAVTNVIYRLVMKYFASELRREAAPLIAPPQRALLKGRTILSATRTIIDCFYNRIWNGDPTIFLKTDFSKAFDFMNREALITILSAYNIPHYLINVANLALKDSHTWLLGRGEERSFVSRTGVRQGCPISPLLYILGVDILTRKLMNIKGVKALGCYADDNGLILESTTSLRKVKSAIDVYCRCVGAEINVEKCTFMSNFDFKTPLCWKGIVRSTSTIYLGIPVGTSPSEELIWGEVRRKAASVAGEIKRMKCSFNARIGLINTYLIPLSQYIGCCYLMGASTSSFIWRQIRRCIGVKVCVSNLGLTSDGPLHLCTKVRDPYIANVVSLISGTPRKHDSDNVSPFSTLFQRALAIRVLHQCVSKYPGCNYLLESLCDVGLYKKVVDAVGRKNLPRLLYSLINGLDPPTVPTHILSPLNLDKYRNVGFLLRNMGMIGNVPGRNALVLLLHKAWTTASKLEMIGKCEQSQCKFCLNGKNTHLHAISECAVARWIFSDGFGRELWPKSVEDLLLSARNLTHEEIKVRCALLHALSLSWNGANNYQEAVVLIESEMKKVTTTKLAKVGRKNDEVKCTKEMNLGTNGCKIFFDGSACPILRNGGFGVSLQENGVEVDSICGSLGNATVNDAELFALYMGIKRAIERGYKRVTFLGDSKLVVGLGTPGSVCFNAKFFPIFLEIQMMIKEFESYEILHIPRRFNGRADVLAYTGCNNPSLSEFVKCNFNCERPKRNVFRPHTFVIPSLNKSMIWHHRVWNPTPSKCNEELSPTAIRFAARTLELYRSSGGC